jgi:hypothetical protein
VTLGQCRRHSRYAAESFQLVGVPSQVFRKPPCDRRVWPRYKGQAEVVKHGAEEHTHRE